MAFVSKNLLLNGACDRSTRGLRVARTWASERTTNYVTERHRRPWSGARVSAATSHFSAGSAFRPRRAERVDLSRRYWWRLPLGVGIGGLGVVMGSVGEGCGEIDQLSDQPGGGQAGEGVGDLIVGVLAVSRVGTGVQRHTGLGLQEVEHAGDEHGE